MSERDHRTNPMVGDIVASSYESIGERHVIGVYDTGIKYYRVHPTHKRREGFCLPSIWTKWCRAHRTTLVQANDQR